MLTTLQQNFPFIFPYFGLDEIVVPENLKKNKITGNDLISRMNELENFKMQF